MAIRVTGKLWDSVCLSLVARDYTPPRIFSMTTPDGTNCFRGSSLKQIPEKFAQAIGQGARLEPVILTEGRIPDQARPPFFLVSSPIVPAVPQLLPFLLVHLSTHGRIQQDSPVLNIIYDREQRYIRLSSTPVTVRNMIAPIHPQTDRDGVYAFLSALHCV